MTASPSLSSNIPSRPLDLDLDGLSIGPDALILEGGSIRDAAGNVAETELGHRTISNDALHKVDGGQVRAVASLPALELAVGAAETVDLSEVFRGDFAIAYAAHVVEPGRGGSEPVRLFAHGRRRG